jgi:hypothetical protein
LRRFVSSFCRKPALKAAPEGEKLDCCATPQGPELGLLLRSLRALAVVAYRTLTLPYADSLASVIFVLTFLWVLVFQKAEPISPLNSASAEADRRAA